MSQEAPNTSLVVQEPADSPSESKAKALAYLPNGLRSIFRDVIALDANDRYFDPSCPVCNDQHRIDAEKLWKSFDAYVKGGTREEAVKAFFESKKGSCHYSMDALRHHFSDHMDRGAQELRKISYLSRVDAINSSKMSTIEIIERGISVCWERIISQNELVPDSKNSKGDTENHKTANINMLLKTLAVLTQQRADILGEMKKDGSSIVVDVNTFNKIADDAINKAQTKEERAIIAYLLQRIGGIVHQ